MKYEPTEREEFVKEKRELLIKLGFEESTMYAGKYFHSLVPKILFDFTASSVEGIVQVIFMNGLSRGELNTRLEIQKVLGIIKEA